MHNNYSILLLLSVFLLQGCLKSDDISNPAEAKLAENQQEIKQYIATNNLQMQTTTSGLYYQITKLNASGQTPKRGDQVVMSYVGRLTNGTIIDSAVVNKNRYLRFPWNVGAYNMSLTQGIEEAAGLMHEGDSAKIIMPFYLGLGNISYLNVPAYSVLVFDLKLEDVQTQDQALLDYAQRKALPDLQKTSSGLYYSFVKKSSSTEPPSSLSQVFSLRYKGEFLNGIVFDSTRTTNPDKFDLTVNPPIAGFKEGIRLMRAGEKAVFLLPSTLAYGDRGAAPSIPPYTPIVFEVEMVSVQ